MKKITSILLLQALTLFGAGVLDAQTNIFPASGSVGIGTLSPDSKSILDMQSTSAGVLIPRMTTAQRTAIVSPPQGLLVYQTTFPDGIYYYGAAGWVALTPSALSTDIAPLSAGTYNLGTGTYSWENLYIGNGIYHDGAQFVGVSSNSIAIGKNAMDALSGANNLAMGSYAMGNISIGHSNIAIGNGTLESTTTGSRNTAVGFESLHSNLNGQDNIAIGYKSLHSSTSSLFNTAIGYSAFTLLTTGSYNTSNGYYSGYNTLSGSFNVYSGANSGYENTLGNNNSAVGYNSLHENVTGSNNTAIGHSAGTASNNFNSGTFIGASNYTLATAVSNITGLGYNVRPTASNQVRIGNSSVTSIGGYAGWTNLSDGRFKTDVTENVVGLEFILKLRPVTYHLNIDKLSSYLGEDNAEDAETMSAKKAKQAEVYTGFIAQEVEQSAQASGFDFSGVDEPKNDNDMYGLRYAEFVVPIVKSIQEMHATSVKQEATIATLENKIALLETENELLAANIAQIKAVLGIQPDASKTSATLGSNIGATLEQNIPNPFSTTTIIRCYVPETAQTAQLIIYTNTGETIQQITLQERGWNEIDIDARNIESGILNYTLIVDQIKVDSKTMVIVK